MLYINEGNSTEFAAFLERQKREHAIETGIIERLYDLEWGVTEALVAEGISAEVVAREGVTSPEILRTITDQLNGLQLVVDLATGERPLSPHAIREMHAVITRSQATYEAHGQFGRPVHPALLHGEWKRETNHVRRPDGSLLEYAPAEQVDSEMDTLIAVYGDLSTLHPVVLAAWLHHRFIAIHPFQDGNGRVARALVLLVLLKHHYAPLVVEGRRRDDYLRSLDRANDGDLWPLTRLFSQLEIDALRAELEKPALDSPGGTQPTAVAQAYVDRILRSRMQTAMLLSQSTLETATRIHEHMQRWLDQQAAALREVFGRIDPRRSITLDSATPLDEVRGKWWRAELVGAARALEFFSNHVDGTWWLSLRLNILSESLRYLVILQKVGHGETGVLALSVVAQLIEAPNPDEPESRPAFSPALELRRVDSLTFTAGEPIERRFPELDEVLERTLSLSLDVLGHRLG